MTRTARDLMRELRSTGRDDGKHCASTSSGGSENNDNSDFSQHQILDLKEKVRFRRYSLCPLRQIIFSYSCRRPRPRLLPLFRDSNNTDHHDQQQVRNNSNNSIVNTRRRRRRLERRTAARLAGWGGDFEEFVFLLKRRGGDTGEKKKTTLNPRSCTSGSIRCVRLHVGFCDALEEWQFRLLLRALGEMTSLEELIGTWQ